MRPASTTWRPPSFIILAMGLAALWFIRPDALVLHRWLKEVDLQAFKTVYISIMLEAFPFILLGVIVSSLLQVLVSERLIQKLVPRNIGVGLAAAALIGILFPVCECGMIPVVRRLILKGMPASMGVTYLLAAPILNPVVYFATYTAFLGNPSMVYARMGLAFFVAVTAGFFVYLCVNRNPLKIRADQFQQPTEEKAPFSWMGWAEHMLGEFFSMGKYLLFGVFIASCLQTFVARELFMEIGQHSWASIPFMMGLSYVLSLCSTSDAFVAASFNSTFSKGALTAFMVFGPMLDFKSTLMLFAAFRARFVMFLMLLIMVLVGIGSMIVSSI